MSRWYKVVVVIVARNAVIFLDIVNDLNSVKRASRYPTGIWVGSVEMTVVV
jgi:hypothetical protein